MFTHVVVGSNDLQKSKTFYDALFGAIGGNPGADMGTRLAYMHNGANFMVTKPINGEAATFANGGTIGFGMASAEQADAWHAAGVANGGTTCEDAPGPRDLGFAKLHLAYLRDPDGNKLCAMYPLGQ
ncbi:VOC family protein [Novosphingobium sp. JCM 18896]|uniref:VOC family protein n=1 Tax=Novosphingobium sp. JCM 18896 TaxID=2989731 RepID=UPI002222BFFA|nr:VOC family protein [Novosphingobium sp. JCM 18896]MCW1430312.1 VOC family protein [Novosphingobium sp. JCM 18896]